MNTRMRDRYLDDSFATASPATLLVRLYDRLVLDLEGAETAIVDGDTARSHELLTHAQDIVTELHVTLDVEVWSGGTALAQLYEYASTELVQANLVKDADRVRAVHALIAPLRDAWRDAASQAGPAPSGISMTA